MNKRQFARELKSKLVLAKFVGGSLPVFGFVTITPAPRAELLYKSRFAKALIHVMRAQPDPEYRENPRFIRGIFGVTLVALVQGDDTGEAAMIGYGEVANESDGAGLLRLEEVLMVTMDLLTGANGAPVISILDGDPGGEMEEGPYLAANQYLFSTMLTRSPIFPGPTRLKAVDAAGVGDVDLTWRLPPARYDRYRSILVRKAGATAPANVGDGTEVALGDTPPGTLVSAFTDSPGPGAFSYSLWTYYDEISDTPDSDDILSDFNDTVENVTVT